MELNDYLRITIKGLAEDSKNLKQYFIRNQKIYERDNFVKAEEFYSKLNIVISDLKTRCKKRYYENKKELYLVLELKEAKNENTKEIQKEINETKPSQFPLNLLHLTDGYFKGFLNYSDIEYIESVVTEILDKETDKPDDINDKVEKSKKTLKAFFNPEVDINIIEKIQNDFKGYKGKKMAFLIYLLHKKFKIISYSINSRSESRKHFVSSLKGCDFRMSGIDKFFEPNDVEIKIYQFEKDNDFTDIEEILSKTIK
jgi:hypothetical protein